MKTLTGIVCASLLSITLSACKNAPPSAPERHTTTRTSEVEAQTPLRVVEQLTINNGPATAMRATEDQGIAQIISLSITADQEDAWLHITDTNAWIDIGTPVSNDDMQNRIDQLGLTGDNRVGRATSINVDLYQKIITSPQLHITHLSIWHNHPYSVVEEAVREKQLVHAQHRLPWNNTIEEIYRLRTQVSLALPSAPDMIAGIGRMSLLRALRPQATATEGVCSPYGHIRFALTDNGVRRYSDLNVERIQQDVIALWKDHHPINNLTLDRVAHQVRRSPINDIRTAYIRQACERLSTDYFIVKFVEKK